MADRPPYPALGTSRSVDGQLVSLPETTPVDGDTQ
jgi:hypothetical protein